MRYLFCTQPDSGEVEAQIVWYLAAVAIDHVFLCVQAPFRPINSGVVASIVDHALSGAGVENPPSRGATRLGCGSRCTLGRMVKSSEAKAL